MAALTAIHSVEDFFKNNSVAIEHVIFVVSSDDAVETYEGLRRFWGRDRETIIETGQCKNCIRPIRMPRKSYERMFIQGMKPNFCGMCSREKIESRICDSCGQEFPITRRELDESEQLGNALPKICPKCRG